MRQLVLPLFLFLFVGAIGAAEPIDPAQAKADPNAPLLWYDVRLLGVEGKGWTETKAPFDRLPAKADGVVRDPVWNLSRRSAGMAVRFVTDAPALHARWTLTSDSLAMPHMPATGVSGLDLYVKQEGRWRWLGAGRPGGKGTQHQARLVENLPAGKHEFMLYLPLYNGVSAVEIGIAKEQMLLKAEPRPANRQKPIVFYGTSITQGTSVVQFAYDAASRRDDPRWLLVDVGYERTLRAPIQSRSMPWRSAASTWAGVATSVAVRRPNSRPARASHGSAGSPIPSNAAGRVRGLLDSLVTGYGLLRRAPGRSRPSPAHETCSDNPRQPRCRPLQ